MQWEAGMFVDDQREREDAMHLAAGRDELSRSFGRFRELCSPEALSNIEFA